MSHGFDHGLNVARYCLRIFDDNPGIQEAFGMFQLKETQIKSSLELLSYLHDCGYPHLHGRDKGNHAVYSAFLVEREVKQPLGELLNLKEKYEDFYKLFFRAIFAHNADTDHGSYTHGFETTSGLF